MNEEELGQKINEILTKSWTDSDFKNKLMTDTTATLKAEGIEIPDGYTVNVYENTGNSLHFVLPPNPNGELSDLELEAVAGGKGNVGNKILGGFMIGGGVLLRNPAIIGGGINRVAGSNVTNSRV